ncbi:hypothetical protein Tco_0862334 [Tanacetum coccineum]
MVLLAQSFRATLPQTNNHLRTSSNTRNQATIQDGRVVVQNVPGRTKQKSGILLGKNGTTGNGGLEHIQRNCTQPHVAQNSYYFMTRWLFDQHRAQKMFALLDEETTLFGWADKCDAFDSDVDDEPNAQSIFMANLSSAGPANLQAGPSNAKKAQPALYDGEELLKTHHVPVIVSSSEEDLELAEITRVKMHEKMNDSACVEKRALKSLPHKNERAEELKANAPPPLPVLPPALRHQLKEKMPSVTSDVKTPKVSAFENLTDTLDTLRKIGEEARSELPSDTNLDYACVYTKRSQELLENASASCPKVVNKQDKFIATTPVPKKKHVTFADPLETSGNNTPKHVKQQSLSTD